MVVGEVKPGKIVRVKKLCGGRRQQGRLCSLGVFPGAKIRVLDACCHGACRVVVRGAAITLCEKMQQNIEVEFVAESSNKLDNYDIKDLETVEV